MTVLQEPSWRTIVAAGSEIGERPVWDARTASLLWVDILVGGIHRSRPGRATDDEWTDSFQSVGSVVGSLALRQAGGVIAAVDTSIRFLDERGRDDRDPVSVDMPIGHRFNDGACDPRGRFLVGTAGPSANGVLWTVGSDGQIRIMLEDVTESNGLGWSADGQVLYYIDSGEPVVRRYAYDPDTGSVGPRLLDLVDLVARPGVPDGLVVDAWGRVWVSQWQGAELACFDADGSAVARWPVPVSQPTCPGFALSSHDLLVLATSWEGMDAEARSREPWAGHLLAADVPVAGRPTSRYAS